MYHFVTIVFSFFGADMTGQKAVEKAEETWLSSELH